jgi:ornithine cyclodeaminase
MILLDDAQIVSLAQPRKLIDDLATAFRNAAETPARFHADLPGGDGAKLLIMPAWDGRKALGVKIVTSIPVNRRHGRPAIDGVYVYLDGQTGEPLALLSAPALTALRTAAVSALAASMLARTDARTLLMIGTGALAPHLVAAHLTVRPLERVMVWGRDHEKAARLAQCLSDLPVSATAVRDLPAAVGLADIICSATSARAPLIEGRWLSPGAHVDLVGSFAPDMREADSELFRRATVVVDTPTALEESGDLLTPLHEGVIERPIPDLGLLLRAPALHRRNAWQITVFKSVGTGLADLTVARSILSAIRSRLTLTIEIG